MRTSETRVHLGLLLPTALLGLGLAIRFVPGWVAPLTVAHFIGLGVGPLVGLLCLLAWWMFVRRVPRRERWLGLLFVLVLLSVGFGLAHRSMPQFLVVYGVPVLLIAAVSTLWLTASVPWRRRRGALMAVLALSWLPWLLVRQDGQVGELTPELSLRWAPTAEERFLAQHDPVTGVGELPEVEIETAEWPGFRGPARDGRAPGVVFSADWDSTPPREVWRRRVGPGWSSFAVAGEVVFTQEQRGEHEVVAAYTLAEGSEIWASGVETRFEEAASGAGPRATPTVEGGRIFALTATGVLRALDVTSGEPLWERDLVEDTGAPLPPWGFSSSPLVAGGLVVVFAGGREGPALVAYDRATGEPRWRGGEGALSYSSAHLATLADTRQVLLASDRGLEALDLETGARLWEFERPLTGMARIVQPVVLGDGQSVILGTGYGEGSKRLRVERDERDGWNVTEVWSSIFLKPYFNDLVCSEGTCYGFDNKIFAAIDVETGERRWKGGRYGHGQVVLLPEMDLLLVLTESGQVVLLEASPEEHREVARFDAIEGKTWNHPVVARGRLLVRNGVEAACFELPV